MTDISVLGELSL